MVCPDLLTLLCRRRQKKLAKAAKGKTVSAVEAPMPVSGRYPLTCLGVTSEAFADALNDYVTSNPHDTLRGDCLTAALLMTHRYKPMCRIAADSSSQPAHMTSCC